MTDIKRGILVGYDGSDSSWQAIWWAVEEPRQHRSPLVVAHIAETDLELAWGYWLDPIIQDHDDPKSSHSFFSTMPWRKFRSMHPIST